MPSRHRLPPPKTRWTTTKSEWPRLVVAKYREGRSLRKDGISGHTSRVYPNEDVAMLNCFYVPHIGRYHMYCKYEYGTVQRNDYASTMLLLPGSQLPYIKLQKPCQ